MAKKITSNDPENSLMYATPVLIYLWSSAGQWKKGRNAQFYAVCMAQNMQGPSRKVSGLGFGKSWIF